MSERYVTHEGVTFHGDPIPSEPQMEEPECYRLYRLCTCWVCSGMGKSSGQYPPVRCKACRGEGRTLDLVATCGTKEAVGTALVTLAEEGEWDECPIGIMYRPEGQTGKWLVKPWLPSARNISDAGRTLAKSRYVNQP